MTTVYVTHDQTEAMTLGDLVAVMKRGVLQQASSPQELYARPDQPVRRRVHRVAGDELRGSEALERRRRYVRGVRRSTTPSRPEVQASRPALAGYRGRSVILGIRPEMMEDAASVPSSDPDSRFPVILDLVEGMGSDVYLHYTVDAPPVFTEDTQELASDIDAKALADLQQQASEQKSAFITRAGPETRARAGENCEISRRHAKALLLRFRRPAIRSKAIAR